MKYVHRIQVELFGVHSKKKKFVSIRTSDATYPAYPGADVEELCLTSEQIPELIQALQARYDEYLEWKGVGEE